MHESWLYFKSRVVGTPLEGMANRVKWVFGAPHRWRHPELWEMHYAERQMPLVLQKILRPNSNAVDVGCHIGSFLTQLLRLAPAGRHMAFEASPTKGAWLRERFPQVEVVAKAVADKAGYALFQEDVARPGYSHLGEGSESARSYEVETCRLDDVLSERDGIDLIKLDIEGGELAALRGAVAIVERHRPWLIFECGSEYMLKERGLSRQELFDHLTARLRYEVYGLSDFIFDKGPMGFDEFRRCGLYPFRGFNFVGRPSERQPISDL